MSATTSPDRPWLAAVAIVPILATVYQTLVLTDVTDDVGDAAFLPFSSEFGR